MLENTSIIDLALEAGLDLIEQIGGDYVCLCPFHDDNETPSMRIYTDTNTWYCFGCQQGSSVFDFTMLTDGSTFQEALNVLAAKAGYAGTYALKTIRVDRETEKFSMVREKIELAILRKYLYIYRNKKTLGTIDENTHIMIDKFWAWYDRAQTLFNRKVWEGTQPNVLESKLYEFYSRALQELNFLDEEKCYES